MRRFSFTRGCDTKTAMNPLADKEQVLDLIKGISLLPPHGTVADGLEGAKRSLAAWLTRTAGPLQHPRLALFAGSGADASKAQHIVAEQYFEDILSGEAALCEDVQALDADLRVYELDLKTPRAVTPQSLLRAAAYGMMAVEPGVDIMAVCGFGGGIDDAAAAFIETLPGADDPFGAMNGETMAALAGAIIAARLAGIPVILDGACAVAALLALVRVNPAMADHCATSWQPPQAAKQWLRERTALLFMPQTQGEKKPGLEGAALMNLARSL